MKVYVYHETNDNEAFGEMLTKVFKDCEKAEAFLRERVEKALGETWDECRSIVEDWDGTFQYDIVAYPDGDGWNFFTFDEKEVIE